MDMLLHAAEIIGGTVLGAYGVLGGLYVIALGVRALGRIRWPLRGGSR